MSNGNSNGWVFLKNWGWAFLMLGTIAVFIANLSGHTEDNDVHMTTMELDERYVPREIFQLTMENIKRRMADNRVLLENIDKKLDNQQ